MTTDLIIHADTDLTLADDQHAFSESQRAALAHMGVSDAPEGDLQIFFHRCRRTGLDPFLRQIYMIGRESNIPPANDGGQWRKEIKYTIQTGIDGFRVIGHRAASASKHTVALSAPEWAHLDGTWRPVWVKVWGTPVAARVTITRNGQPFTAVALFDEYAQTKRSGALTKMWEQRPAGQIAKCAEALAWRMSFPHDLSGVYIDEEMQQADNPVTEAQSSAPKPSSAERLRAAVTPAPVVHDASEPAAASEPANDEPVDAEEVPAGPAPDEPRLSAAHRSKLFATFSGKGITDPAEQLAGIAHVIGRPIESRTAMTVDEFDRVIAQLASLPDGGPPEGEVAS